MLCEGNLPFLKQSLVRNSESYGFGAKGTFSGRGRNLKGTANEFHQSPQSHGWHTNVAGSLTKLFVSPVTLVKEGWAESSNNLPSDVIAGGQACQPMVTSTSAVRQRTNSRTTFGRP